MHAVPPVIDTIQEFKVNSHNDQAEFGSSLGRHYQRGDEVGNEHLHGSAWEFVRNDAFDARNTFQDAVTIFRQNQFGFTVGGPVVIPKLYNGKNKTFFYGGLQEFRYRSPANNFFRVPTAANYAGDLSDIPTQIYNPFTTRADPNHPGQFIRDPFPNNQIPTNLIDQDMVKFAPGELPAAGPLVNGHNAIDTTPFSQNVQDYFHSVWTRTSARKDFVWFRYSATQQDNTSSGGRPGLTSIIGAARSTNYGTELGSHL